MDQIISVIRRCLPLCFPLPESDDENEAYQVVVVEAQSEDEEAAKAAKEAAKAAKEANKAAKAAKEANRKAWVEVIIARCEVASLNDGCRWHGTQDLLGGSSDNPFPLYRCYCTSAPDCPVSKEVQRCLDDPTILITKYKGTHNHPLPVGGITAMAASTALSDGTSSVTQAYRPYHACYLINPSSHPPNITSINPNDPSKGVVVDLTSNSDDPLQLPVRDEDQNQAPKILVGGDSKKDVQSNSTTRSSSFSNPHCNYEVFLSFRGEDTRKNFTDHLYNALVRVGIHTFRDDKELRRGKTISTELRNVIRGSKIFIVIFSKSYASSRWCLDELVEIVHRRNIMGHTLLPIFYHVNPSDVRHQTGTFEEAFAMHEKRFQSNMERVQSWRLALTEAANCSGWDLGSIANGYESSFIEKIVAQVSREVEPMDLNVARHPIGINYRVNLVKDLLNLGTSEVLIVGIYGMGGIGKTTLAKAVYKQIYTGFEGSSFLNIKEETTKEPKSLVRLQEQLLSETLKAENLKINNVDRGINLIEKRIHGKRVLIVLDDVDDLKQLHALVEKQWFGPGSRIIVTTRDEHLLSLLGADTKYEVDKLNHCESLKLFSWQAFTMAKPKEDYLELSNVAVDYARGLPLAIEVLGSFLRGKEIDEWKDELLKLLRTPDNKIQKIFKTSLDSLDEYTMDIFLDIACFFVGMDKEYVIKILHGCDFFPVGGIKILTKMSLLTIDAKNKLRMHDLIQDMGREIVREKSPKFPEERSRLWFRKDVLDVLRNHTGTKTVEGLILEVSEDVRTEAFTNMNNLRLLQINDVHLIGSYERLSKKLRWLCWHGCPLKFLPHNFHLENLVILDMQRSNFKQVWEKIKILNKLKVLNLSNSKHLTKLPVFSQMLQLEKLILEGCVSLVEIHRSIGCLKKLILLNLKGCRSLRNLPSSISNLKFLKTLDLSGCLKVDKLPEQIVRMMALTELLLDRTAIKQLPPSFGLLEKLETLSLSGCSEQSSNSWLSLLSSRLSPKSLNPVSLLPASVSGLLSLKKLSLIECNLSEDVFPADFGSLPSLEFLDLSRNNFRNLPDSIGCLPKLYSLCLSNCTTLQSISGLFRSVEILDTRDCTSMETLSISPYHKNGLFVDFRNCYKLTEIQGFDNWEFASILNLAYDSRSHLQCRSTMGDDESCSICLTGSEVPNFFSNQTNGCSISVRVPSISKGQFLRFLVCVVYACSAGGTHGAAVEEEYWFSESCLPFVTIVNKSRGNFLVFHPTLPLRRRKQSLLFPKEEDHLFLFLTPRMRTKYMLGGGRIFNELVLESGDEIEVEILLYGPPEVKKCGVHVLIFDEPNVM